MWTVVGVGGPQRSKERGGKNKELNHVWAIVQVAIHRWTPWIRRAMRLRSRRWRITM
jgi:hypothetical protein